MARNAGLISPAARVNPAAPDAPEDALRAQLAGIVLDSAWFMRALSAVRELGLPSWCIGAGAVRNLVWDHLHGYAAPSRLQDVDVAYFDAAATDPEHDAHLQARLSTMLPGVPWEVTNQATVHHWFEGHFGHAVAPLRTLEEAVASWPEFATAVGVRLHGNTSIHVIAPHGLRDLFDMVVRRNPTRASVDTFRQRVAQKRYAERWPKVAVVPC